MKIPLAGTPEGPASQATFAPLDVHAYDQVGEAGRHFGDALQGIGDLGVRIKGVWDDAAVTNIATKADAAKKDAINALTTSVDPATGQPDPRNNDPTTYKQRWEEAKANILKGMQEDPMDKGLGFEARGRLKNVLNNVVSNGDVEVRDATRTKMLAVAGAVNDVALKGQIMAGHEDAAQANAAKQVATGQKTPEWGAQQKILIPEQIDQNAVIHLMTVGVEQGGGPFVAQDKLKEQDRNGKFVNFTRLLPEQRQAALAQATKDGRILMDETASKYANAIANQQPIDPAEVKADLAYRTITPTLARSLLKPAHALDTSDNFNDVMGRISKLDPANKDWDEQFKIGQTINNFTGINKTRAEEAFKEKMNPDSPLNTPVYKAAAKTIEGNFTAGIYGRLSYKKPNGTGGFTTEVDAVGRAKANDMRAQMLTAVQQYATKNPDATPAEVNDYINTLSKTAHATSFWGKPVNPLSGKASK